MRDINVVTVIGRLVREPELKKLKDTPLLNFSIASSNGKEKNGSDFFDCQYWGKGAEAISSYLAKGKQVLVQGRLEQHRWEKDGNPQSKIVIRVESLQLIGRKEEATINYSSITNAPITSSGFDEDLPF